MSKIVCDICGTTYQDTADCCPICGYSNDTAAALLGDGLLTGQTAESLSTPSGGRFTARKKREIFDYDEVNPQTADYDEDDDDDDYDDDDDGADHNTGLVILLTVLIVVLLLAAGFLFLRFYLPNSGSSESKPSTVPTPPQSSSTTEFSIPCKGLTLTSGAATLSNPGQYFLLNVIASPEDTTDKIIFESADTNIATVSADGRITAVSEGETVVYITCGESTLECKVTCKFTDDTNAESSEPETTEDTVPETTAEKLKDVVLKLKQYDFVLNVPQYHTLRLDCDLDPSEVEWTSEHPSIATVDETGKVTAVKTGVTDIIVRYGDQEARCKVRIYP